VGRLGQTISSNGRSSDQPTHHEGNISTVLTVQNLPAGVATRFLATQEDEWLQQPQALPYPTSHPDPEQFPSGVERFLQVQLEGLQEEHMRRSFG
jgi:hypothetical protein